mmetsp:Transcript_15799/g.29174  ORF Transcript_15799/g.29174 Transcript_15799/m.29174 type:complete len:668 (+) Transcript_15799:53-2056(+)
MLLRLLLAAVLVRVWAARNSPLHVVDRDAAGVLTFSAAPPPATRTLRRRRGDALLPGNLFPGSLDPDAGASFVEDASASTDPSEDGPWTHISLGDVDSSADTLGALVSDAGGIQLVSASASSDNIGSQGMVARGTYHDRLDEVGWGSLMVHLSEGADVSDSLKMYAAGAVEGYLTAKRILQFYHNSRGLLDMNPNNDVRVPRLKKALQPIISQLRSSGTEEPAGHSGQVRLALLQTWGIRDGYALALRSLASEAPPSMVDMLILNSDGVVDELLTAYGGGPEEPMLVQRGSQRGRLRGRARGQRRSRAQQGHNQSASGHCTGLVRLAEGNSELYFGHTTWETFSEMTRIWKVYDFPLRDATARRISFSSYPGCVSSTDDYYLMDNGLAVTETTLSIPSRQQYPVSPAEPDFARIMAVNRLSSNAEEWVRSMEDTATGTYSSQWMVMDYRKFAPRQELLDGAFYVLEQAPGASHFEDMSGWLREKGYWASFDRAFFDEVRASTGDSVMEQQKGESPEAELYSKGNTPRAQIIRQTAGSIASLDAMREEMTRNKGTVEPVDEPSLQVPRFAISARDDLKDGEQNDSNGSPDGGVDAKVTSSCLFRKLTAQAISSPSHAQLPAFRWTRTDGSEVWPGYPHEGLPNEANFDWVQMQPQEEMLTILDNGACQ